MANIRSDQEFLPYAHEAITRGYSEQTVLKEGMFEDLSLANKQLRLVLIFLMVCFGERWSGSCSISSKSWLMSARGPSWETVIGKKNCRQILTEVGLRNLFVPITLETVPAAPRELII
ncbi:hypothetical protein EV1_019883 [Malus domestica]